MTRTTRIQPDQLQHYFDTFTRRFLRGDTADVVDIEFLSPDWGDQPVATNARLMGITYDPPSRTLGIVLDSGEHRVLAPREVWVLEEADGFVRAIEAVREDGSKDVVRVKWLGLSRGT